MELLLLWQVVEIKFKLVSVMNLLAEDAVYDRQAAIGSLTELLDLLDQVEKKAREEG